MQKRISKNLSDIDILSATFKLTFNFYKIVNVNLNDFYLLNKRTKNVKCFETNLKFHTVIFSTPYLINIIFG